MGAITAMLDRADGDEAAHVEGPHTFDQLAKLSRKQRRQLLTQLERERTEVPSVRLARVSGMSGP